eukprot:scaffold111164_cov69-Phaeocystis_antarctica.AAC.1
MPNSRPQPPALPSLPLLALAALEASTNLRLCLRCRSKVLAPSSGSPVWATAERGGAAAPVAGAGVAGAALVPTAA